ncbi:hypothetical protein FB466_0002 [Klugiella xanthotipulae]|uniref:Uncharacterized protein n=1 Tax=Klugiella xanthotipulae TaxID=244735 RepID=A0A543HTB5_9MICO|nr:hypothetical protein FB466_2544 [Klugiella xanthotipulae]TQM65212.1 hypothetical protein FB466_0002 [Klugiella xanthotipulae]
MDRRHFNDEMVVAVVAPDDLCDAVPGQPAPSYPDELVVSVFRRVGVWETWVVLSTGRRSLVVSVESARRLYDSLGVVLGTVAGEFSSPHDVAV